MWRSIQQGTGFTRSSSNALIRRHTIHLVYSLQSGQLDKEPLLALVAWPATGINIIYILSGAPYTRKITSHNTHCTYATGAQTTIRHSGWWYGRKLKWIFPTRIIEECSVANQPAADRCQVQGQRINVFSLVFSPP